MVSTYQTTDDGKHICPNCKDAYSPEYESKSSAKESGDKEAVEQYISGLCSTECWNEYLSVGKN